MAANEEPAGLEEVRMAVADAIDRLDEIILDVLQTALHAGDPRPSEERRLSRARNALRRGLAMLGDEPPGEDP
jgi:hypothetical protein